MCAYCLADDNPSEGQLSEYFPPLVPQQRPAITKRSLPTRRSERLILNVREDVQTGLSEALLVEDEDNLPVEDEAVSILCCLIDCSLFRRTSSGSSFLIRISSGHFSFITG